MADNESNIVKTENVNSKGSKVVQAAKAGIIGFVAGATAAYIFKDQIEENIKGFTKYFDLEDDNVDEEKPNKN